jgi:hypothetical protein
MSISRYAHVRDDRTFVSVRLLSLIQAQPDHEACVFFRVREEPLAALRDLLA